MSTPDEHIIKSLLAGGFIGATLGAMLSTEKEEGSTLGSLASAVLLATFKANIQAHKTNIPVYTEENGKLYKIEPDGKKVFIKDIPKPNITLEEHFKLK